MQARRIRALVLAAGLGTRLRPLTTLTPKPLLPVRGVPVLGHTLAQLAAAGCEAAAVNLHYLGDKIREHFGDSYAGMPLTWSEEPRSWELSARSIRCWTSWRPPTSCCWSTATASAAGPSAN